MWCLTLPLEYAFRISNLIAQYEGTKCYGFYLILQNVNQWFFRTLHKEKISKIQNLGFLRPFNFSPIQINASYSFGNLNQFFMGYAWCSFRLLSFSWA